ncbi:MAG: hypothetical protein JWN30_966 [Bacilli bacterium]|nr:hypothetical protein [Bacilli bacterium]
MLKLAGKFIFWTLAIAGTFLYTMFQGGYSAWFLFTATLMIGLYAALTAAFSGRKVLVARRLSTHHLIAGATLDVEVEVTFPAGWPVAWLHVEDQIPARLLLHSTPNRSLLYPWFRRKQILQYSISQIPRGKYTLSDCKILTGDLFGLTKKGENVTLVDDLTVYPRVVPIANWPALNKFNSGNAYAQSRSVEEIANVIGVRDYAPGDRLSRIHWRATARSGALKTKEFELHVTNDLCLILDRQEAGFAGVPGAAFELSVTVAASLAHYAFIKGYSVALASFGKERYFLSSSRGPQQNRILLDHLSIVQPDGDRALHDIVLSLSASIHQGTSLAVCGPILTEELANAAGLLAHRKIKLEFFLMLGPRALTEAEQTVMRKLSLFGVRVCVIRDEQELSDAIVGGNGYVASS